MLHAHGRRISTMITVGAWFTAASLVHAGPHKIVDLKKLSDVAGEYSLSLCARPSPGNGIPGHAFVGYGLQTGSAIRFVAVGFTTNSALQGALSYFAVFPNPPGFLKVETYSAIKEECLVLLVNEADFEAARKLANPFYKVPGIEDVMYVGAYELTANDCVTFMQSVARLFQPRIKVPERGAAELPLMYARRLVESN